MPRIRNTVAFFYALLVYIFVVLLVFFKLYNYKDLAVKYTDMKDAYIDIELGANVPIVNTPMNQKELKELFEQEELKKHITEKMKNVDKLDKKESNLNELFGKLDFQENKSSKIQASHKSQKKSKDLAVNITKKLDSLKENISIIGQNQNESKAGVYDPFLGALRRILEQRWRLYKSSGDFKARVNFSIDASGYFSYDYVELSGDDEFDKKLNSFLENLKGKYITLPPNSKPYSGVLELSDKIKQGQL